MKNLRSASGREFRSPGLFETPLPISYDATIMPGACVLGTDGQLYESIKNLNSGIYEWRARTQKVHVDALTVGIIYVGTAPVGSSTNAPAWTIIKTTYSAAGIRTSKGTATGVTWTGRASHTYS
jgi:hypothetical protein